MARAAKNAMRSSGPRKVTMAGIEWEEKYGCFQALVNHWLKLSFHWEAGDMHVQVAGHTLKTRAKTEEQAAILATSTARVWARRALEVLEGGK